jgi:hypothetical protein
MATLAVRIAAAAPVAPAVAPAAGGRYALFRLDPLGLPSEIVEQLEGILRVELVRAVGALAPPQAVDRAVQKSPRFANCTADPACLAPLAQELQVQRVVAGSVAGLGDSYVVNLRLVDDKGRELGRVSETLHGRADQLIQEVRVAVYRLVAPQRLVGAISLLSEVPGATVTIDERAVGVTPLAGPIDNLPVGEHLLRVARSGYAAFVDRVPVRFEKATEVVVRQQAVTLEARVEEAERAAGRSLEPPVYSRWWFWLGSSAVAIGVGVLLGGLIAGSQATRVVQ